MGRDLGKRLERIERSLWMWRLGFVVVALCAFFLGAAAGGGHGEGERLVVSELVVKGENPSHTVWVRPQGITILHGRDAKASLAAGGDEAALILKGGSAEVLVHTTQGRSGIVAVNAGEEQASIDFDETKAGRSPF
jgi:hypothetical protein